MRTKQYNMIWWMEDHKPVMYKDEVYYPSAIMRLTDKLFKVILQSPNVDNGIAFAVETEKLSEFKPIDYKLTNKVMWHNKVCMVTNTYVQGGKKITISPVGNGNSPAKYYDVSIYDVKPYNVQPQ